MEEAIRSRPYHPDMACERCIFGRGLHAEWCQTEDAKRSREIIKHISNDFVVAIETMEYSINPPWIGYLTQEQIETWNTTQRGAN